MIVHTGFQWNYTTVLNLIALAGFAVVYWLYRHRDTTGSRFAKDPMCGMQVEIANAPARRSGPDATVYFCSDHCAERYDRGASSAHEPTTGADLASDQVCGMDVDPATATVTAEHAGRTVYFCATGCREAFLADPDRFAAEGRRR